MRNVVAAACGAAAFTLGAPSIAAAQANANAVAGAEDAFGFRSGDDAVGIYDESSVRGFDLQAAGNYRLDGTYFVKNSGVSSFFLESTTVRIGYNTLNAVMPGPSGVVDFRLRDPRRDEPSALTVGLDAYQQPYADLHLKGRGAADRWSYSAGVSRQFDIRDSQGGDGGEGLLLAGTTRISAGPAVARLFAGEYRYHRPGQFVVQAGDGLPPRIERGSFLGQDWAMKAGQRRIAGVLIDANQRRAGLGATAVFSQEDPTRSFTQVFSDLLPDGSARSFIIATPAQRSTAWSGEIRAHVQHGAAQTAHRLDLTLRGRRSRARFGGSELADLGRTPFGEPTSPTAPPALDGAANQRDSVDQWGLGLTYRARLRDRLRLNLGLLRTDYEKTFVGADGATRTNDAAPWLYNAGAAWRLVDALELYGSYSRGLEEAGVAPASAGNRNEVLEAIRVTQREVGVRYAPPGGLNVVLAAFDTRKPYAAIDPATGAYGFLGKVRHRGVEASISGRVAAGTSIVLGGVLLDPRLSGEAVDDGSIGGRPVAVPRLRAIVSADHEIGSLRGLSVDAAAAFVGARPARSALGLDDRQLKADALITLNLGARYRFRAGGHEVIARAQVLNVFNRFEWEPNASETLTYSEPRRMKLVLTTLF